MSAWVSKLGSVPVIAVIGCGNMGGAIIQGLCKSGGVRPSNIIACDSEQQKIDRFEKEFSVRTTLSAAHAVERSDIVILAVKPFAVADVLAAVKHAMFSEKSDRLLVSVAAGVRTSTIQTALGRSIRIARVMPNLPCLIGVGMTGVFAPIKEDAELVRGIFSTLGEAVVVSSEDLMDVVTAVSASGPAFVFAFIDALAKAGATNGLSEEDARLLAVQTVRGSAQLVKETKESPEALIRQVATPGGTTEAGLAQLKEGGLEEVIRKTIAAATNRARELAR